MKKSVMIGLVIIFILGIFSTVYGAEGAPKYRIEKLTPEIIRVVALEEESIDLGGRAVGYGPAFAEAIKEIGKNYVVEEITAVNYVRTSSALISVGYGSYTRELLIKVSPRN